MQAPAVAMCLHPSKGRHRRSVCVHVEKPMASRAWTIKHCTCYTLAPCRYRTEGLLTSGSRLVTLRIPTVVLYACAATGNFCAAAGTGLLSNIQPTPPPHCVADMQASSRPPTASMPQMRCAPERQVYGRHAGSTPDSPAALSTAMPSTPRPRARSRTPPRTPIQLRPTRSPGRTPPQRLREPSPSSSDTSCWSSDASPLLSPPPRQLYSPEHV